MTDRAGFNCRRHGDIPITKDGQCQHCKDDRAGRDVPWTPELIEDLAHIEHARWSRWHKYARSKWTIENLGRWDRQADTDYRLLSESEKESDRREVLEYLPIIFHWLEANGWTGPEEHKLAEATKKLLANSDLVHAFNVLALEIAKREQAEKEVERLKTILTSQEPCPKCGAGVQSWCYGCELKKAEKDRDAARGVWGRDQELIKLLEEERDALRSEAERLSVLLKEVVEDGECYCLNHEESLGRNPCTWCKANAISGRGGA